MDDIYDDLENYNDVNALEELRNENRELKFKLEEYTTTIEKLQKDLDKVSSEFKKLEINYSSLLRTAKAEIERKTQIITNLNNEKDMLVLSSIQNSNKGLSVLRRNMARGRLNNQKLQKEELDSTKIHKKDIPEVKKHEPERLRNDENRLPTPDTVSSGHTDDTNKIDNIEIKLSKESYDKSGESKENIAKGKKALSLKNRRKSMPVISKQATFSSDEEYEDDCSDNANKRERPSREDKSRKYFDRHKLTHKISETSGIDEKYSSCHESSRETFYKINRFSDKYKIPRDKSRNRKHFSPEKSRRVTRDYQEDNREEIIRHNRVLVSPPRESFDSLRQFRDRRPNYERDEDRRFRDDFKEDRYTQRENFHEGRHFQEEDFPVKRHMHRYGFHEEESKKRDDSHEDRCRQKYQAETHVQKDTFEKTKRGRRDGSKEDKNKQRDAAEDAKQSQKGAFHEKKLEKLKTRVDPFVAKPNKRKGRFNEEKQQLDGHEDKKRKQRSKSREDPNIHARPTMDKASSDYDALRSKRARIDSVSKPTAEVKKPLEPPIVEGKLLPEFTKHMQHNFCQSPDNPPLDAPAIITCNQPKEIMNTAATFLEDPRITSKKYLKGIEADKVVITTAIGRNVDLVPIDISTWKTPRVDVPKALKTPEQYTDEMVHDIYADVDNPNSKMSMISGENESNHVRMADYLSQNFHQDYENERINQIEARANKQIGNVEHQRDLRNEKLVQKDNGGNKESTLNSEERKLPPVRYKISRVSNAKAKQDTAPNPLGVLFQQLQSVCGVDTTTKQPEPKLNVDETFGTDDDTQDKPAKIEEEIPRNSRLRRQKMTATELVEGDLALSDETMDNIMVQKQAKKDKVKEQRFSNKIYENVTETEKETAKPAKISSEKKTRKSKTDKVKNVKKEESNSNDCTEKQSNDKSNKKPKIKPVTNELTTSANENQKSTDVEKKTRGRKPKSAKKFPDLFGDSSSLITPEDLGVVTEQSEKSNKYVPIFEDAQDAVDVNVGANKKKELEITQPPVTSSKTDEPVSVGEEIPTSLICKISLPIPVPTKYVNNDSAPVSVEKPIQVTNKLEDNDLVSESVQKQIPRTSRNENHSSGPVSLQKQIPMTNKFEDNDSVPESVQKQIPATSKDENNDTSHVSVQKITPNIEVSNSVEIIEPEVIKTVIISTGVQPQIEEPQTCKLANKIESITQNEVTKIPEALPIALATSTPHKKLLLQLETEVESNRSCASSEVQRDESSRDDRSSMSNGLSTETQNDDVPDIRIFVRRRRKLKK